MGGKGKGRGKSSLVDPEAQRLLGARRVGKHRVAFKFLLDIAEKMRCLVILLLYNCCIVLHPSLISKKEYPRFRLHNVLPQLFFVSFHSLALDTSYAF